MMLNVEASQFKSHGENTIIAEVVDIVGPEHITVGDNVEFKFGVHVQAGPHTRIGSNTHFAPFCV
ncbi:MAG: hypothetical protein MJH11_02520, partial [Lentisphaeria bacterium]|nr:hypothetical protein [Lentisphaeria bacterium]